MKVYLKYLAIFLLIIWLFLSLELYMVLEPVAVYPKDYLIPVLMAAVLALFPTFLEKRLKEQKSENHKIVNSPKKVVVSKEMDRFDTLTGALSRKVFNEIIGIKVMEAKHRGTPLGMIIFDIDYFKKINDRYGHLVGDNVLKEVAQIVKSNIRESEYFVRWGGEEFVILLPNTNLHGTKMVAEKLRRAVESHQFRDIERLTCSFGVTVLKKEDTITSFIKRADEALYEAKKGGRNQVKVKL